jgi:hypothetical protein
MDIEHARVTLIDLVDEIPEGTSFISGYAYRIEHNDTGKLDGSPLKNKSGQKFTFSECQYTVVHREAVVKERTTYLFFLALEEKV